MAVVEQLVFGLRPDGDSGRVVLGVSPGISREGSDEIVRLCESWGAVPEEGLRRPALLAFPLTVRQSSLTGELHVVIRVASGRQPIYHALVLSRRDFQEFEFNPFTLALEDVFLDRWDPDVPLARREIRPGSFAPVVSPPPGESDIGSADEAVRQMLANKGLLLPLERPTSDSDRFLALVIAGLPRALRQELRFASWAASAANRYTLAAMFKDMALFTAWQPFLMTSVLGQLDESCEDYLGQLRRCLAAGDLSGLERLSATAHLDLARAHVGARRPTPKAVTATISERNLRKLEDQAPPAAGTRPSAPPPRRSHYAPVTATLQPVNAPPRHLARPRSTRRRPTQRVRRALAALLSLAIVGAGAYYLWTSGHWTRLPGLAGGKVRLQIDAPHGIVDVASLYQAALKGIQEGRAMGGSSADSGQRRRGLEVLHQASQLLEAQGRDYMQEADQTLDGAAQNGSGSVPPERLHERGRILARELRRLALAQFSLRQHVDWRDVADLEPRALEARFDSLLAHRQGGANLEPELGEVDRLLRGVDVRIRQLDGLTALQTLLGAERWEPQWNRRCEAAIDDLGGVRQDHARRLRADALALVRLKQAEHATDLGECAFREDYTPQTLTTAAVADVLPALYAQVRAREAGARPPLVSATADLYAGLAQAADGEVSLERHAELVTALAANRAVAFDPAAYADHVARVRYLLFERLLADGLPPDSLPQVCFAGGFAQEYLDFQHAREVGLDGEGWRRVADAVTDPFLGRWATRRARAVEAAARAQQATFAADFSDLEVQRLNLLQLVASGADGAATWVELARAATRLRDAYATTLAPGTPEAARWDRVARLAAALESPPALSLAGVTVRMDAEQLGEPRDVIVELAVGDEAPRRSSALRLGPAAPAGTGWVGTGPVQWTLRPALGTALVVQVLSAADGTVLASLDCDGWLRDWQPHDLGGLDTGRGVKVSWRLARPYWDGLVLPELAN